MHILIFMILFGLFNIILHPFIQNDPLMNTNENLIGMSLQVEEKSDSIKIIYTVTNSSDKDIYLTDILINYQDGKPQVNLSDIKCSWLKPKGFLLISNICTAIPEGMSLLTDPTYFVTLIKAKSTYNNMITMKIPVFTADIPSGWFSSMIANGIILKFGYSFYSELLNLSPAEELGSSIFIANYAIIGMQHILTAEQPGLSIPCKKR